MCDPFANVDPSATRALVRVTDCTGKPSSRTYRTLNQARRAVTKALNDPSTVEVYTGATWCESRRGVPTFFDTRCTITVKGSTRTYTWKCRDHSASFTGYPNWIEARPPEIQDDLPVSMAA